MRTIYKYELQVGTNVLQIPYTKVLSVINQHGNIMLYCLVDTKSKPKDLHVHVMGTGYDVDEVTKNGLSNTHFLGTVVTNYFYVWHVFFEEM